MYTLALSIIFCLNILSCFNGKQNIISEPNNSGQKTNSDPSATNEEKESLISYLKEFSINPKVEQLAKTGVANYKDPKKSISSIRNARSLKGGRSEGWIKETFDKNEQEIIDMLKDEKAPQTWSVDTIAQAYKSLVKEHPRDPQKNKAVFNLVEGVNVNYLHDSPYGKNSILQLASQFNFLEAMRQDSLAKVEDYILDHTQGPQGSIEAAAAALHRTAMVKANKLSHSLIDVLPKDHSQYYQNGYLMLYKIKSDSALEQVKESIKKNIDQLKILPQWVINESSGNHMLQVFSAAPSYQNKPMPAKDSLGHQICEILVMTQYKSTAEIAVIRSLLIDKPVNLHLTLVGQGAFNNPREIMRKAFEAVANTVKGYQVNIFVHAYKAPDSNIVEEEIKPISDLIDLRKIAAKEFMTPTAIN
jgi:hypothetical protein